MSSADWAEIPGGKGLAPMVSKLEATEYPALLFPPRLICFYQCARFSQDWSEDLLTVPLGVLSSGPKFLGKIERGERPSGVCRKVAGLRTSQGDIPRLDFPSALVDI